MYKMNLQKQTRIDSQKLRDSARGEDCCFEIPGICNHNPETVVLCHSGEIEDGKGWGLKGSDFFSAFGCSACHAWFDNKANYKPERRLYFHRAMKRTQTRWFEMGLVRLVDGRENNEEHF